MDRMTRESITTTKLERTVEARSKVVKYPSYLESENAERVSSVEEIVGNLKAEKPQDEKKYIVVAETASDLDEFGCRGRTRRFNICLQIYIVLPQAGAGYGWEFAFRLLTTNSCITLAKSLYTELSTTTDDTESHDRSYGRRGDMADRQEPRPRERSSVLHLGATI
ncbi:hypothetical protein EVAR_100963_1 [Eumeta japonica]|uniref:Uncharacterized protein n=1 Tax=Eumeta variegata TaxID=151549 RepID=A0A4C2ABD3_EUMVA|nr:hypothetical protein EVAR_100963_1 [Eumeta japonica]